MDRSTRRNFKAFCRDLGLEISALCGDLGGHGFLRASENPMRIEESKRIVDLAADVGTRVVTTHIGVVPDDSNTETYKTLLAACRELGRYAEHAGITFAIETGPEKATTLKRFLDEVGSKGVGVNLDPANLVMVTGDDPVQAVHTLKQYIVHTHAKDGVQLQPSDPVQVYGAFADAGIKGLETSFAQHFQEVPLGQGSVDWDAYLKALQDVGYAGYLTVEREVGEQPEADIREAIQFLRAKIR
jgi:sugar phosphate isomerase/epimerase